MEWSLNKLTITKIFKQIAPARRYQFLPGLFANYSPAESGATAMVQRHPDEGKKVVALKSREPKEAVRPHFKASIEDAQWAALQSAPVQQLWIECQIAEHFGANDWREVKTTLEASTFRKAKAVLQKRGLFDFKAISGTSGKGRMTVAGWLVHNKHGYYNKHYWEVTLLPTEQPCDTQSDVALQGATLLPTERRCSVQSEVKAETLASKEVENFQPRVNYVSTTHQLPTKVVGGVVSIPSKETEESPLGGIPPTMQDGMPEKEVSDHPLASLEGQTEAAGKEAKNLGWGNLSAAVPPPPANFPIQVGDMVSLDWPDSPFHGRTGKVSGVDVDASEADIGFDGLAFEATFPISRLLQASPPAPPDQLLVSQPNAASLTAADNANLVTKICDVALAHDCRLEDFDKEAMEELSSKVLEKVLEIFQSKIAQHSCFSKVTKRDRFLFALNMGRRLVSSGSENSD